MAICREVIDQLERAQEDRHLTPRETDLIKLLKVRLLCLAAIQKSRARQISRLTWLRKGDANTRFFQIMANVRKKKNFIHSLQPEQGMVTSQEDKHNVLFSTSNNTLGPMNPRVAPSTCPILAGSLGHCNT
jgi:hypothetical protein